MDNENSNSGGPTGAQGLDRATAVFGAAEQPESADN